MTKIGEFPGAAAKKAAYAAPRLAVYGSVRELTGNNSGTKVGDAGTMMSL
ncbi:MAG: lasso RiPP family leader peptide-containing protein [Pseudomonadota bacterium]